MKLLVVLLAAAAALVGALEGPAKAAYEAREAELVAKKFAPETAKALARIPLSRDVFAVLHASRESRQTLGQAAQMHMRAGKALHLDTFDELLGSQVPANTWERRFLMALERDAAAARHRAVTRLAAEPDFIDTRKDALDRIADGLRMVRQTGTHGLVPLYLILEDYRAL